MSKIADTVYMILKKEFSLNIIIKEHYINYKGTRLFFDFFIKDLRLLIEVQGQQHIKFIKHFHLDKEAFVAQKKRDNLKIEYVQENNVLSLVRFNYDEKITKKLVLSKILKAQERGFYE